MEANVVVPAADVLINAPQVAPQHARNVLERVRPNVELDVHRNALAHVSVRVQAIVVRRVIRYVLRDVKEPAPAHVEIPVQDHALKNAGLVVLDRAGRLATVAQAHVRLDAQDAQAVLVSA